MAKGIPVRGTEATIYEPTAKYESWRIVYIDRATNERRTSAERAQDYQRWRCSTNGQSIGPTPPTAGVGRITA